MLYIPYAQQTPEQREETSRKYEEDLKARKEQERKQEQDNLVLAQTVAILLGAVVLPYAEGSDGYNNWFPATFDDGRCINLRFYQCNNENKISVSGNLPAGSRTVIYTSGTGINISASKTPQKIAQDIERRLMPEYNKVYVSALERKMRNDLYEQKCQEVLADICLVEGTSTHNDNAAVYVSIGKISGEITSIRPDETCTVELRNVPVDLLKKYLFISRLHTQTTDAQ